LTSGRELFKLDLKASKKSYNTTFLNPSFKTQLRPAPASQKPPIKLENAKRKNGLQQQQPRVRQAGNNHHLTPIDTNIVEHITNVLYPKHMTLAQTTENFNKLTSECNTVLEPFIQRLQSKTSTEPAKNSKSEEGDSRQYFKEELKRYYKVPIS
jgi:hypothetical protein